MSLSLGIGVGIGMNNYKPRSRKKNQNGDFLLYNPQSNLLWGSISLWYPHIESEMILYFAKYPEKCMKCLPVNLRN